MKQSLDPACDSALTLLDHSIDVMPGGIAPWPWSLPAIDSFTPEQPADPTALVPWLDVV